MSRRAWTWVKAGLTILILVVLPTLALRFLEERVPAWPLIRGVVERFIGPFESLILILLLIGLVMAGALIVKGYTKRSSIAQPIATSIQALTGLYLTLWFLGLGDPWALGLSERSLSAGQASLTVLIDLRLFAVLAVITALLIIVKSILDRAEARREEELAVW